MILDRVTITGADESVSPEDLIELSIEFPFVEWGILYSHRQSGNSRYPKSVWTSELADLAERAKPKLSAHICGRWVRDIVLGGEFTWRDVFIGKDEVYGRIQLNFHAERQAPISDNLPDLIRQDGRPFITQQDGINDGLYHELTDNCGLKNVHPLFDVSGGAGILPGKWPSPFPAVYQGYAGGLGPDNLEEQLKKIDVAAGPERVWIDMETRVRSSGDQQFDLVKVRRCLEIATPFVQR